MSNRDNIEITLITENDRERMEQVAQMETDVFPDPWSYHEVRSTVRQKHTFCAAAMEGDTLLGYFLCYYVLDECEIARIAVAESERRRGIGQMLFGFMEQICQEKQLKRMLLDVRKSNQTAIAFYEKKQIWNRWRAKVLLRREKSGRCNPDEPHGLENGRNRKNIQDFPLEGVSL